MTTKRKLTREATTWLDRKLTGKATTWLDKTIKWKMHLEVLGARLAEGRLDSPRIQAWLRGTHYPEVLPRENGKPRMVRFVAKP